MNVRTVLPLIVLAGGGSHACTPTRYPVTVEAVSVVPSRPISFGYKCSWLAIKGRGPSEVLKALSVKDPTPANWDDGFKAIYELDFSRRRVFVTPAIDGWVFVVGTLGLPPMGSEDDDESIAFTTRLSADLKTTVQYFCTNRVVEQHGWILAQDGALVRAHAYLGESGETLFDQGKPTEPEISLGEAVSRPNEDVVMSIAGAWGLSPQKLDTMNLSPSSCWVAVLAKR